MNKALQVSSLCSPGPPFPKLWMPKIPQIQNCSITLKFERVSTWGEITLSFLCYFKSLI